MSPALLTGKGCLLNMLDYLSLAADTSLGVCQTCWTYMSPALLTGKWCLLSVLDYLGPTVEIGLVSVGRIGLYGSGLVDRHRVSARRVGLYGSGHGDKGSLLGVLDLYGSDR